MVSLTDDLPSFQRGPFKLILDDLVAYSYLQNVYTPNDNHPSMTVKVFGIAVARAQRKRSGKGEQKQPDHRHHLHKLK
jgi:hypothetical protein